MKRTLSSLLRAGLAFSNVRVLDRDGKEVDNGDPEVDRDDATPLVFNTQPESGPRVPDPTRGVGARREGGSGLLHCFAAN